MCSLHLDPSEHSPEQLVVQSLFADGFIRYSAHAGGNRAGLSLITQREIILPDSDRSMSWSATENGMHMTLARDIPERVGSGLRAFVSELFARAEIEAAYGAGRALFAVHPGGPKIIDCVRDVLRLDEAQVEASRAVLFQHGNMSSATLPHIWQRIAENEHVAGGTPIVSLAFGPGLTLCGAVFIKR